MKVQTRDKFERQQGTAVSSPCFLLDLGKSPCTVYEINSHLIQGDEITMEGLSSFAHRMASGTFDLTVMTSISNTIRPWTTT